MKSKYIIQMKRNYLWEDIVNYDSRFYAIATINKLRRDNPSLQLRMLEVLVIC